ncbi:MAG: 50S ribosomal protein L4 [Gemmatimonadetes bacterium]|nr:50S ribosomal protein L4 [Gemmatimonadota bacterium]
MGTERVMASVEVTDLRGEVVGSVDLPETIFGIEPSHNAIYHTIKSYMTNQRQGNAHSKTRAEIRRSKRKMYRQKGTGRSRAGSASSPVRVGGGVAHGPRPRELNERVSRKVRRLALKSALSLKVPDGAIKVVEDFTFEAPKTKRVAELTRAIEVDDRKVLLLTPEAALNVLKSCRNLSGVKVLPVAQVSTYDVVNADAVVFTQESLGRLQAIWGST